ncbi:MAG TPA: hypothetical protein ENN63_10445 [Bacteroidetes bacterium]|nr:hypothetical protein [Bacteroidota bacterium]
MSVTVIILLILLGIILFLVEFLLVPGITVAGIGGAILLIGSIYLGYHFHGPVVGNYILLGTIVVSVLVLAMALKSKTWRRVMLGTNIDSRVDAVSPRQEKVEKGAEGETLTRLNPIGKVMVNGKVFEGKILDGYLDPNVPVTVVGLEGNKLIVKPKID